MAAIAEFLAGMPELDRAQASLVTAISQIRR